MYTDSQEAREKISKKLKDARDHSLLTQAEVAEKTGMHVSYYARIERGEINTSIEKLHSIAKALKIELF